MGLSGISKQFHSSNSRKLDFRIVGFRKLGLVGRRVRHCWRLYVIVDSRRAKQSAVPSLVHRDARLRRDVRYSPSHAVVLDGTPRTVVWNGAVLQGDAAAVGELGRVDFAQLLLTSVDVLATARLTGVGVFLLGGQHSLQVPGGQGP